MLDVNNQNEVNLKKFWSFINSKTKENSGVATHMKNGTVHSDSLAKADILNMQFSSVFTIGNASNVRSECGSEPIQRTTAHHRIRSRSENITGRHKTTQGHRIRRDAS